MTPERLEAVAARAREILAHPEPAAAPIVLATLAACGLPLAPGEYSE